MRNSYKTKQKELIKREIQKYKNEFTIQQLFTELNQKDQSVGLTTIYRTVNNLVHSHILSKKIGSDGVLHYHILEKCNQVGHCHLKCETCGKLTHTDCDELNALSKHFFNQHHFQINQNDITIHGTCEKCRT